MIKEEKGASSWAVLTSKVRNSGSPWVSWPVGKKKVTKWHRGIEDQGKPIVVFEEEKGG